MHEFILMKLRDSNKGF